jgi:SAM-dependent methyltransferase
MTSPVRAELFVSVFVTGAAVILIEILGTRVMGPVFGVSLFVWSALLAVTLGSLALGYYSGGVLVDRAPTRRLLGLVVAAAGLLLCFVPLLSPAVLQSAEAFGPRGGSLLSATLLFAPCLVALGMVGPIAVRLSTSDVRAAGHGVGSVYAVSTAGSLVGTFVTAFLIVPAFETDQILFGAAIVLTLMGTASLAWHWRREAVIAVALPVLAAAAMSPRSLPSGIQVLDRSHSLYGLVEVIDDLNRQVRFLRADHSVLGAQFLRDHSSAFAFIHLLESVRFLRPAAKDMLQIGLGTGALPTALGAEGIQVDVVEIDPVVVRFARSYFGFATRGEVYEEDARTFLRRTESRYDLVVHDTFTGGTTPEHLLSLEVLRRIRDLLRPGGVLALNFVGYQNGPKAEASWAVARTLRAVFPMVRTFGDGTPGDEPDAAGNLIFFASDDALTFAIPENAHFENERCERVLRSFQGWEVLQRVPGGPLITDSRNPLARLQLPIAEEHFDAMNKLLPVEVWLH